MQALGKLQFVVDFFPTKGNVYWYIKNSIEEVEETQKHNKLVEMVKSLQSFIDPKAYKETYKDEEKGVDRLPDGQRVGTVDVNSDLGRKIQEATQRMIEQQMREMSN